QAPDNVLRPRPWSIPDYEGFTKTEFKNYFPHDAYNNEDNPEHWEKGDLVLSKTFDTEKSKTIDLKNIKKWLSGAYILELETKDKFGQEVKDIAKTMLFSDKDKTLADQQLITVTTDKSSYNVGDKAILTFASAAKNITVTVSIERDYQITENHTITLNQNKKTISISVDKNDLGGFGVHYSLAAFNSYSGGSLTINVPYPQTDLEIETLTFRDKLQPGTDETWSFKVKGTKGEKIASEFLASMYDASLDQFKSHNWNYSPFKPLTYYTTFRKNNGNSFGVTHFRVDRVYEYHSFNNLKSFDQFNWFGFAINNNGWFYKNYINSLRANKTRTSYDGKVKDGYVKGTVSDENGLPLPSATITVKGSTESTTTDFDGNFIIKAKTGAILTFSYVGYGTMQKTIGVDNVINLTLKPDNALDEVVITALGIERKADELTGATENEFDYYRGNEYTKKAINEDGTVKKITLRGNRSLTGDNAALIVVDGVIMSADQVSNLDPNSIVNTQVLKGAGGTALYGSQGANGVIIITTKKGATEDFSQVKARTNLQETAFFFPQLATDKDGNVSFNFTTPEALTRWNLNVFAHDKQGNYAQNTLQTVT
ncbi:MAG: carboxypeptidase-like regulatory domain-containing protein, partial [Olleya sp.]